MRRRGVLPVLTGLLLVVFASVALLMSTGDRLTGSFGRQWLTYDSTRQPAGASGTLWLVAGTVFLPGIGFSLAYRTAPVRWRPAIASFCLALFTVDLVFLLGAILWFDGTGHTVDQLFGMSGDVDGSGSIVFVLMTSAPLIMIWLGPTAGATTSTVVTRPGSPRSPHVLQRTGGRPGRRQSPRRAREARIAPCRNHRSPTQDHMLLGPMVGEFVMWRCMSESSRFAAGCCCRAGSGH